MITTYDLATTFPHLSNNGFCKKKKQLKLKKKKNVIRVCSFTSELIILRQ